MPQAALHSIFCNRLLLHIRGANDSLLCVLSDTRAVSEIRFETVTVPSRSQRDTLCTLEMVRSGDWNHYPDCSQIEEGDIMVTDAHA